ncbi:hypothetical protein SSP24_21870 [Streptomyces spinoverrucosus]|uniref:Uncharacterized protein n=1 Tax=Streptomyces spinoverrucosus TaxID=284043 RepID=A0A4Y3VBK1_9ACTN|nr:hypothetical protein [Streptomyces spinoverrucosus]GEC04532.1 hypothetical protein SSP24_21870 [Streptomyces spinoverrucosus]GHB57792.1 hypothetical protein GCM10010397_30120 [Streptomyces spinoverrucosus]
MTDWIGSGAMAWLGEDPYGGDETVLAYYKGTGLAAMTEGLIAQHRPPFAYGNDAAPGDWGVIVHPMFNPARGEFDDIDYRKLCPEGAELMVFIPNPCVAKGHGPKAYHYKDGRISSCIDYEDPAYIGEYWPNKMAPLITAAGLDYENEDYEEQLTRLICDHLGLPALDRATITVDRDLMDSYF